MPVAAERAAAIEADKRKILYLSLWAAGDLSYMLYGQQLRVSQAWRASWERSRKFYLECSRRWGKSFWLCVEAVQMAIRMPGAQIRYAAPTGRMVRTIIEPLMLNILADAPTQMTPRYSKQDGIYHFPNRAQIHVVGCDNGGHERLRGAATHLGILDECAFIDHLNYIVSSILMPQTMTTDGMLLLASTPGLSPTHKTFSISRQCMTDGSYVRETVYDCEHLTPALIEEYKAEATKEGPTTWRREYLVEWVVDAERAVVPEWVDVRDTSVCISVRPDHFRSIVAADLGFNDLTVVLFGYYDFGSACLVVEDEAVCPKMTSEPIDDVVAMKEKALGYTGSRAPIMHVADATPFVIQELNLIRQRKQREGGWVGARKDDAEAALNAMRVGIANSRIVIDPRCQTLIDHLASATWNASRTSYERQQGLGHFDGVDALKYMWRHADKQTNPAPGPHGGASMWYRPRPLAPTGTDGALSAAMTPRHKRPR